MNTSSNMSVVDKNRARHPSSMTRARDPSRAAGTFSLQRDRPVGPARALAPWHDAGIEVTACRVARAKYA